MYLDREYRPRRRRRGVVARFWPLFLLAVIAVVFYETRPAWLVPRVAQPTPTPTRSAVSFLADAENAMMRGDLAAALVAYGEVARLEPNNPDPQIMQAKLYIIDQQVRAAYDAAARAVDLAPQNANALTALARAEDWLGDYEDALSHALDAYDIDPANAETLAVISEIYADVGNYAQAQTYIDAALNAAPDNVLALRNKAYLLEKQGKYEEAVETLNQAIAQAPQRYDLYLEQARVYRIGLDDYEKAIQANRAAVDANKTPATLDALGEGFYNAGDHLQAIKFLREALDLDPDYGPALVHLGMAMYARQNFEEAAQYLERGLPLIGDTARIEQYYTAGLAHVYKDPRECELALPWLRKALEIEPESGPALVGMRLCAESTE
ncbi:MAG: tetratricopeptide repeat protein [Caldilineaceae bacterium]|nr:tetratricopeptide repeat protein [Caldilineaceae bacterium]